MTESDALVGNPFPVRQWVPMRKSSMDLRVGTGILKELPRALRTSVGRPHGCALLFDKTAAADAVETLRRNLSERGFDLSVSELSELSCSLVGAQDLCELLASLHVTGDDLVVVVGNYETLSVASFACAAWCDGVSLAQVPTSPLAAILAGPAPRALDLPGAPYMIGQEGSARFSAVDTELFGCAPDDEPMLQARAAMVKAAMCDSEKAFGELWDSADDLVSGSPSALVARIQAAVKSCGKTVSASSAAVRQSVEYGRSFSRALLSVAAGAVPRSVAMADGMRFAARLAAASQSLSVDDMFTQDDLLEKLGLGTTEVAIDGGQLLEAIRAELFSRTRRLMLALPGALGRVRLAAVDEATLAEHVGAWCSTRPTV